MANIKELRSRVRSVENTKKITYAMKLVSGAKLSRAQDAVTKARAYTSELNSLLNELLSEGLPELSHPLMEKRETVTNLKILVVGANKGLCGAYNTNIHKRVLALIEEKKKQYPGVNIDTVTLGKKPMEFFRRRSVQNSRTYDNLSEDANSWPFEDICHELEMDFREGRSDEILVVYTKFRSAISMTVTVESLIPFVVPQTTGEGSSGATMFEPGPVEVFSALIPRLLRSKVRQACLDAKASELGARMTAMDSATKNAGDIIRRLTLLYNRLRQSKITLELLDIVGGANAIQ